MALQILVAVGVGEGELEMIGLGPLGDGVLEARTFFEMTASSFGGGGGGVDSLTGAFGAGVAEERDFLTSVGFSSLLTSVFTGVFSFSFSTFFC